MNAHPNFARLFVLALAAAALSVRASSAQDFQGKFTLNHQAQWGQAVLQPGSYTLTLTRSDGGQRMVRVQNVAKGNATAIILPAGVNASLNAEAKSDLVCIRQEGKLIVRALEAGPTGETVYFHMPRGEEIYSQDRGDKHMLLAMGPQLVERVSIERGRK